jgi:hypothetical protein
MAYQEKMIVRALSFTCLKDSRTLFKMDVHMCSYGSMFFVSYVLSTNKAGFREIVEHIAKTKRFPAPLESVNIPNSLEIFVYDTELLIAICTLCL